MLLNDEEDVFSAGSHPITVPFASLDHAGLEIAGGASRLRVHPCRRSGYRAQPPLASVLFDGGDGVVEAVDGEVRVDCGVGFWSAFGFGPRALDVALSPDVPWSIVARGGLAHAHLDLEDLDLDGLEVRGGAHRLRMSLPRPVGTVPIEIRGGVHDCSILRPRGVPMAFELRGGASDLTLDGLTLGAVSGFDWSSPDFEKATDRYVLTVRGGSHRLSVTPARRQRVSLDVSAVA